MSRHRDIRNMDYSDDYDGYDDVYGHSVDDDFYISPSNRQFMYNRENSTRSSEGDIKEEDEVEEQLTDAKKENLESCITQINSILGSKTIPRNDLVNIIVAQKFNIQQILNVILDDPKVKQTTLGDRRDKDVTTHSKNFFIPKLMVLNNYEMCPNNEINRELTIPKIPNFNKSLQERIANKSRNSFIIPKLKLTNNEKTNLPESKLSEPRPAKNDVCEFNSLSELVSSHLGTPPNNLQAPFKLPKLGSKEMKTVDINMTTNKMAQLQVSNSKSLSSIEKNQSNWHIDLTVALKSTQSLPSVSKDTQLVNSETFDIPFIDCEKNTLHKKRILSCSFDISDILMLHLINTQPRSNFGRALCKNYKKRKPIIKRSYNLLSAKVIKFDFTEPSPDDIISEHLRR